MALPRFPVSLQASNPTAYQTAIAQATASAGVGQFGQPVDATKQKAVTINIVPPPADATCTPACYDPPNVKVKVGTTITWVNKSTTPHTVTAMEGLNPTAEKPRHRYSTLVSASCLCLVNHLPIR